MASPLLLWGALALLPSATWSQQAPDGSAAQTTVVSLAAVLPEDHLRFLSAWPRVGSALGLALEAFQPQLLQAGLAVRLVHASSEQDGNCSELLAGLKTVQLNALHDPDLLLGLGCGAMAPETWRDWRWWLENPWDLPFLTAGHYYPIFGDGPTVYSGPLSPELGTFLALLQQHFNWTSRAALAFSGQAQDSHLYDHTLRINRQLLGAPDFTAPQIVYSRPEEAVQFIRIQGRVVYIFESLVGLQNIIHLAQAQNMTNGDYVFLYMDVFGESLEAEGHREAAKPWQNREGRDAGDLREAFQECSEHFGSNFEHSQNRGGNCKECGETESGLICKKIILIMTVLVITFHLLQTPKYQSFQRQLILRAQRDFDVALNDSQLETLVAACYHDVLLLYIRALNETLNEGGTKRDTDRILEKMQNLKIQGVTGTVSLNSENEREMDFDLWSMADMESGKYQVVGHYMGSEKRINWTGPIHWKKGGPPLDNPPCVFNRNDPSCASWGTHDSLRSSLWVMNNPLELQMVDYDPVNFQQNWKRQQDNADVLDAGEDSSEDSNSSSHDSSH